MRLTSGDFRMQNKKHQPCGIERSIQLHGNSILTEEEKTNCIGLYLDYCGSPSKHASFDRLYSALPNLVACAVTIAKRQPNHAFGCSKRRRMAAPPLNEFELLHVFDHNKVFCDIYMRLSEGITKQPENGCTLSIRPAFLSHYQYLLQLLCASRNHVGRHDAFQNRAILANARASIAASVTASVRPVTCLILLRVSPGSGSDTASLRCNVHEQELFQYKISNLFFGKYSEMDTESFASQYIALSRATGSVCDAFGNRVELKNIPKLLHKVSRGQFRLVWSESFCARDHVALERLDSKM